MHRATAKIQQVDAVRLTWVDTNNRKETIFKPLDCDILHVTLKPCRFPFLNLKHKFYYCKSYIKPPPSNKPSNNNYDCLTLSGLFQDSLFTNWKF